jgi:Fur family ferric uptake transcriptional regulator
MSQHHGTRNWADELRRRGHKATPQRTMILRVLEQTQDHLSAEEIGRAVEASAVGLSRSTVYRTVETLAELGIIKATRMGRSTQYELAGADDHGHHHLVCSNCGRAVDLQMGRAATVLEKEAEAAGFEVEDIDVVVTGRCADCRAAAAGA